MARRRSGGSAVLVGPGRVVWADFVIPAGDELWQDDVGRAAWWVGEAFVAALGTGVVHRGPLERGRWGELVCFAGLGPGEVTIDGAKAVGISQRRTRAGARFQCAVHRRWDPDRLASLLAGPVDLRDVRVAEVDLAADAVLAALPG